MKKLMLAAGFAAVAMSIGGDAVACGDKLVIVGRGMRPKRVKGSVPASILVYADPKGSMPAALDEGHLRQDLEKAGHRVRSVGAREELDSALGTGSYDLVFTDIKSAPAIETEARGAASKPAVLPTLFNPFGRRPRRRDEGVPLRREGTRQPEGLPGRGQRGPGHPGQGAESREEAVTKGGVMRVSRASVFGAFLFALLMLAAAGTVSAQAWLPPKGEAAFSLGWSHTWADHHIDYTGADVAPGDMDWHNAVSDLSYGITDRFAARVNIPFVTSKYVGNRPHPARPGHPPIDTGSWNSAFTDFRAELRFKATTGSLAVTPLVAIVFPSHWYESMATARSATTRWRGSSDQRGPRARPAPADAYLQARYVYAVPEAYQGIRPTRSNVASTWATSSPARSR